MTNGTWRRLAAHLAVGLLTISTPLAAWGWAAASHAYIAKHSEKRADQVDPNELCNRIYGSNAADMFNTVFTVEGVDLAGALHNPETDVAALPYFEANGDAERAFTFGFASHNEQWGTDRTAHWDGVTLGFEDGYVISKATFLASQIEGPLKARGITFDVKTMELVSHILVEHAVDLLLAGAEPSIGYDMMASTACPQPAGVDVLVRAYEGILPPYAGAMIRTIEPQFRTGLLMNGWALTQPNAKQLMAGAIAELARSFLKGPLPENAVLVPLIEGALDAGMQIVAADYRAELDATIGWVNGQMSTRKITP